MAVEVEKIWAAGFFDGEGCVRINASDRTPANPYGYHALWVTIQQVADNREVLDRFAAAVGEGVVEGPYIPKNQNWRPQMRYRVIGKKAVLVLRVIMPWLASEKRLAAEHAIAQLEEHRSRVAARRLARVSK